MTSHNLDIYKPKQEILDLEDYIIELWYGKTALNVVKTIQKCEVSIKIFYKGSDIIYYRLNNITIFGFIVNSNIFVLYPINLVSYNLFEEAIVRKSNFIEMIKPIIKDLFGYQINNIL